MRFQRWVVRDDHSGHRTANRSSKQIALLCYWVCVIGQWLAVGKPDDEIKKGNFADFSF
jgi:hypothetical protein